MATVGQLPPYTPAPPPNIESRGWWGSMAPETQGALIQGGTGILGGLLSGYGQGQRDEATHQFQAQENAADRALRAAQSGDPMAMQRSRQQMAVLGSILPGLRNSAIDVPESMRKFMPTMSGGLRLPETGLPSDVTAFSSLPGMAGAEAQYWKQLSPHTGSMPDLSKVGYGQAGADAQRGMNLNPGIFSQAANGAPPKGYEYDKKTGQLKKKGTPWWKKALAIGGSVVGAIATGGMSLPIQAAVMGGIGAAGGGLVGGKKGALMGGLGGAAAGAVGGLVNGPAQAGAGFARDAVNSTAQRALGTGTPWWKTALGQGAQATFGRQSPYGGTPPFFPGGGYGGGFDGGQVDWRQIVAALLQGQG
jgi:hypothetical protein